MEAFPPRPAPRHVRPQTHRCMRVELVPKAGGGTRSLVRLDEAGRADYARATAPLIPRIEGCLASTVLAPRAPGGRTKLASWKPARARWRKVVSASPPGRNVVVATDVRDCYGSIHPRVVARSLLRLGADRAMVREIVHLLEGFEAAGVRGLPIGPGPSAVLANAVLSRVDRAIEACGALHVRWVDDFVMWVPDRAGAERALSTFEEALAGAGLRVNRAKTHLFTELSGARAHLLLPHPAGPSPLR